MVPRSGYGIFFKVFAALGLHGTHRLSLAAVCGLRLLQACALERLGLRGCGTLAELCHGMCSFPGPGGEPASLASAGGFSATGPPGRPGPWGLDVSASPRLKACEPVGPLWPQSFHFSVTLSWPLPSPRAAPPTHFFPVCSRVFSLSSCSNSPLRSLLAHSPHNLLIEYIS